MRNLEIIFKALAGETRLRILYYLMAGEACVSEIQKDMDISQTITSHHLRILYNAGLINSRREKNRVFYSLDSRAINQNCKGLEIMVKKAFESDYSTAL